MSRSDVETFQGKIVYNLDGSAYIIDADNANGSGLESIQDIDASTSISVEKLSTSRVTGQAKEEEYQYQSQAQEQRENFKKELSQNRTDVAVCLGKDFECGAGATNKSSPKIHSFRVVSAQDANSTCQDPKKAFKIQKPILMCFICKLSFGNVKSFSLHANTEHRLNLEELERQLLNREYSSAIIQRNMDEKPQISFLQPLDINASDHHENLQLTIEDIGSHRSIAHHPEINDDSKTEKHRKQEIKNPPSHDLDRELFPDLEQIQEQEQDPEPDSSSKKMVAPSAYLPLSSPKVAVKSSVKLGSLNSETAKTNLFKVSLTSSPVPSSTSIIGEVSLPSTDNLSNSKSPKCIQGMEPLQLGVETKTTPSGGSVSTSPQLNELDASSSEFLQLPPIEEATGIFPTQVRSFHASLAALASKESNGNRVKLITEFLQHQLQQHQQQQEQQHQQSSVYISQCPDHPEIKGVDCKNCELLDIQRRSMSSPPLHQNLVQSLPQLQLQCQAQQIPHRSPGSNSGLPISPTTSSVNSLGNASVATSSFTIGACSEHINGRPQGVDCARCEMLLNSARLNSNVQISTRNSCKTLKCPQCNWHYKYQETLEIHMREKHPDGESACGYCLAGQQHPRLARGESYSCGYKPYRCEICNYSTTTKGNLSIHMQSDKHLNNMQELNSSQNMVAAAAAAAATGKLLLSGSSSQGASNSSSSNSGAGSAISHVGPNSNGPNNVGGTLSVNATCAGSGLITAGVNTGTSVSSVNSKPKPSFRCDICSYETSVARNLRIHMTSEKHTHNLAVLQNNIKHIQAFSFLQQQGTSGSSSGSSSGSFLPEVALADMAYNQALMIQLLHQQQHKQTANTKLSPTPSPVTTPDPFSFSPKLMKMGHGAGAGIGMGLSMPIGPNNTNEVAGDPTGDPNFLTKPDMWPSAMYSCLICDCFSTNNLDDLNQHLLVDRSRQASSASAEIMVIHNNNYICRLCNYKTNLKANFQLHSKTDKHLQKLNFINHIREGGPRNEYKLQYQQQLATNIVQLKCNCCDFHTNSIQKLSLHSQQMRHDTMRMIFQHLLFITQQSRMPKDIAEDDPQCTDEQSQSTKKLLCQLCHFTAKNLYEMIQHVKSMRHMQVEQFICLQRRTENQEIPGLSEVFKVTEWTQDREDIIFETGLNSIRRNNATSEINVLSGPAAASSAITDGIIFGPLSPSSSSSGKPLGHGLQNEFGMDVSVSVPTTVFKCNLCEYFVQSEKEMSVHIATLHTNADSDDFISIPTNTAALQAFQNAVAAAAMAVVQQRCSTINATNEDPPESGTVNPIAIKPERFEEEDYPMSHIEDDKPIDNLTENTKASQSQKSATTRDPKPAVQCPLCLENRFREKTSLEAHLTEVHSVSRDGLARLLLLVDKSAWDQHSDPGTEDPQVPSSSSLPAKSDAESIAVNPISSLQDGSGISAAFSCTTSNTSTINAGMQGLSCQLCEANFKHEEQLLQHAQQNQHFSIQNGEYFCLAGSHVSRPCYLSFRNLSAMINHYQDSHMSLVISERHVYKYRCKQCSLAFKTQEKLTTHMLYHTMRDATKCSLCQRNFRSTQALQKHMEQTHSVEGAASVIVSSPQSPTPSTDDTDKVISGEAFLAQKELKATDNSIASKETTTMQSSSIPVDIQTQQQHLATLNALLKQQQSNPDTLSLRPEPLSLAAGEFSQHLQNLQNLQQIQQQFSGITASSGLPISPVDMLNLMQFHHLMSLNFMNLAPPLVFGANSAASNINSMSKGNSTATSGMTEMQSPSNIMTLSGDSTNANTVPSQAQNNINTNTQDDCIFQLANNQKRARTRITDDQLKILRAHFDINNSPSEESILEMSQKSNLPMKVVVKHWFRNTLFKERQRNKDSPYNFNNPPSTTLNLEEYERTGHAKVTPLNDMGCIGTTTSVTISSPSSGNVTASSGDNATSMVSTCEITPASVSMLFSATASNTTPASRPESTNSSGNISDYNLCFGQQVGKDPGLPFPVEVQIKTEPQDDINGANDFTFHKKHQQNLNIVKHQTQLDHSEQCTNNQDMESNNCQIQQHPAQTNSFETKSESGSSDIMSRPPTPSTAAVGNLYGTMNDLMSHQLENIGSNMGPPKKLQISGKPFEKNSVPASSSSNVNTQYENTSSSSSSASGGKRANRTRFTDYQIKVLQEFFENNSYPKDSDLEYLSKLLLLSPRVIVVWFQNARQKQRKIYENQPNNSLFENEETKKQNINYACKKCSLVFQRYYELIRHQKNHCFKEENNKKSAKAQIAAAQIAQNLSSEDSNSSMDIHHVGACPPSSTTVPQSISSSVSTPVQSGQQPFGASPSPQNLFVKSASLTDFSPSTTPTPPQRERSNSLDHPHRSDKIDCDKCELQFNQLEQLREHQLLHLMNPSTLFTTASQNSCADSNFGPFGSILQSLQQAVAQHQSPPTKKRKYSDSSSNADDSSFINDFEDPHKKYDFLCKYFIQYETNSERKQQFLLQYQHHQSIQSSEQGHDSELFDLEFLTNFYQQRELKKVSNYDFLLQYYRKQEEANLKIKTQPQHPFCSSKKPTIEFLLQYYQLNESKKFFQLVASPKAIPDGLGYHPSQIPKSSVDEPLKLVQEPEQYKDIQDELDAGDGHNQEKTPSNHKGNGETFGNNSFNAIVMDEMEKQETKSTKVSEEFSLTSTDDKIQNSSTISLQKDEKDKPQYLHNLEDFLDATMIENHSQTLTFIEDENGSQKDETNMSSTLKVSDIEKRSSVSPVNVLSKQNKRLRTTILPEQLNFLYECYQSESNPSRKMLEEISKKVNLKKRVVQVWFQNSRAKDKKSRNQRHYAHISDDNSYDGSSGKDVAHDHKVNGISMEKDPERNLQDCQLCQVTQVNIQKHAFSVEHICKMKKMFEQTTELYSHSNGSGSDDNDSDREKRFYNLSKAFLFQHVVSNTAVPHTSTGGLDSKLSPKENCMLDFDATTGNKIQHHSTADVESENVRNVAGNQDLIQQLFNRNHITGK
ncbi:hypothetical protein KR018_008128, partial [Drosophila ironensis]